MDARSDIYSLGVILYEMLTGEVPFRATSPMGIAHKHIFETPRPPHQLRSEIPLQLEEVLLRALSKVPELRQSSAPELASQLERALYSAGLQVKRLGSSEPLSPHSSFPASDFSGEPYHGPSDLVLEESGQQGGVESISADEKTTIVSSFSKKKGAGSGASMKRLFIWGGLSRRRISIISLSGIIALMLIVVVWLVFFKFRSAETASSKMILIPGGKFVMGNNSALDEAEKPEHEVTVKSFYIDRYEVTNQQYYEFIRGTSYPAPPHWDNRKFQEGQENHPVVNVSWHDAQEYTRWAGKRLPSEEEWEYAARGRDRRLYPWGNDFSPTNANTKESGINSTQPVGSYPAGASMFNVLDLAGNVMEWTASVYQPYPNSNAQVLEDFVVLRGGGFNKEQTEARVTSRSLQKPDFVRNYVGFRCVKDAE